jgi:myo-inositol-1(or 4)-monophosphatase
MARPGPGSAEPAAGAAGPPRSEAGVAASAVRLGELAARVAAAAGTELLRRWGTAAAVRAKTSETDFVTDADLASESLIRSSLLAARPRDGIVGEELPPTSGTSGLTWVVDPLDGTLNYLHGRPQWAVSIAAEVGGQPCAGVVFAPALGVTYRAVAGQGAWVNERRMSGPRRDVPSQAVVGTGFCYRRDGRAGQAAVLTRLLPWVADVRISGAASLDLCAAADGALDAYCEAGLAHHDYAAGVLIAAEAGLTVRLPAAGSDWVVAAPPNVFAAVAGMLSSAEPNRRPDRPGRTPNPRRGPQWTGHGCDGQPRPA